MKPNIAVFGSSALDQTLAADLTLAGYEVNLFDLPEVQNTITNIHKNGGIHLCGDPRMLISGKTGFAKINMVTTNVKNALNNVDVIFCDVPISDFETMFEAIAPYIKDNQIVNFQTYGYWSCLRLANILKHMDKKNIILTESPAPIYAARGKDGNVTSALIRRSLPLATFPANKTKEAFKVLKNIFPTYEMAKNVLEINFENINMLVHSGIAICNIGYFDRAMEMGEKVSFYSTGITLHAGILSEVQDRERLAVCQAYGVRFTSLREHIIRLYDSQGKTVQEAIMNAKLYKNRARDPANIWVKWLSLDVPFAHVPFVSLAELASVPVPIYRAIIEIFGAVLKTDFWKTGLTLDKLGLGSLTKNEMLRYVTEGET